MGPYGCSGYHLWATNHRNHQPHFHLHFWSNSVDLLFSNFWSFLVPSCLFDVVILDCGSESVLFLMVLCGYKLICIPLICCTSSPATASLPIDFMMTDFLIFMLCGEMGPILNLHYWSLVGSWCRIYEFIFDLGKIKPSKPFILQWSINWLLLLSVA